MSLLDALKTKHKKQEKPQKKVNDYDESSQKTGSTVRDGHSAGIMIKPHITEKSARLASIQKYIFIVAPHATKRGIAHAILAHYSIKPLSIHVINTKGKAVTFRGIRGKRKNIKKVLVTLPKGKTLDIY